jgi:DNA-binding GntR family transcriptional regulator
VIYLSKRTSADVYSTIRYEIITGVISSNELILEQAIAQRFEVNRLTAREALQRLCTEKYLRSFPRKGYLVTDISADQLRKIQQVRFQIESLAIRLVIENCTDAEIAQLQDILKEQGASGDPDQSTTNRFHLRIASLSQNEFIYDALYTYLGYTTRYAMTAIFTNRFGGYVSYHEQIADAMLRRSTEEAIEWLRKDLLENAKSL